MSNVKYSSFILILLIGFWCIITQFNVFQNAFSVPQYNEQMDKPQISIPKRHPLQLENPNENNFIIDHEDAPKHTNFKRLSELCPLRKNLCIQNDHWVTPNEQDVFNVSLLMFGTGIHQKYKVYRDNMYATYDPNIISSSKCSYINEEIIILHAWYPHMLWEIWNRIATQLFQYQVLEQFLSKEHRFAIMQLQNGYTLGTVHDLLLSPFTNYPFVHLKSLMFNQTSALYPRGITKQVKFYDIKEYPTKLNRYKPSYEQNGDCTCIKETYWCGFDSKLTKDVKQLPSIFDGLGQHEFGEFSWDMARWYKWYFIKTYGPVPMEMYKKKIKPKLLFIQRRTWRRPWEDLNQTVKDCKKDSNDLFECEIVYFEDLSHIEAIWKMQLTDILIGVHGSGLVNGIFMNERKSILEIIPNRAPDYAQQSGTIMTWIYSRVPQRHAWFPLLDSEQEHELLRDWQKPFTLTWKRLKPAIKWLLETPHDFCKKVLTPELRAMKFAIGHKSFAKKSPLYPYRPKCNSYEYLTM